MPTVVRRRSILPGREDRETIVEHDAPVSAGELVGFSDTECRIEVDGQVASAGTMVQPGQLVEYIVRPAGITVAVATALKISEAAAAYLLAGVALTASIAVSILLRPRLPRPVEQEEEKSFTGSFSGTVAGAIIPLVFGTCRVVGLEIEKYIKPVFQYDEVDAGSPVPLGISRSGDEVTLNARYAWAFGPVKSIAEIRLDDNPIENYGDDARVQSVLGTNYHSHLDGFDETGTARDIAQLVDFATPRTVTTLLDVTAIEIEILFFNGLYSLPAGAPGLQKRTVSIEIQYALTGDTLHSVGVIQVSDSRSSPLSKWFRISNLPDDVYDVKVIRITADNVDSTISDEFRLQSINEIVSERRSYPRIAQTGIRQVPQVQSAIFQSASALVEGTNNVRIYSSPTAYTVGFTRNPAWCCLHCYCDPVVGLGSKYLYERQDLASFVAWAAHCTSKGYNFDFVFRERVSGKNLADIFAGAYDAIIVDEGGVLRVELDTTASAVTVLSTADYVMGSLKRERIRPKANTFFTVIPGDDSDLDENPIIHRDPTIADGVSEEEASVNLFGVRDFNQAARQLAKLARKARLEKYAIEVETGFKGLAIRVGKVFGIAAPRSRSVPLASGRVLAVVSNKLQVDQGFVPESGKTYEITLVDSAGAIWNFQVTPKDPVGVWSNWWTLPTLPGGLTINRGDSCSIGELGLSVEYYRCMGREISGEGKITVYGTLYDSDVYGFAADVEDIVDQENPTNVVPFSTPPIVVGLSHIVNAFGSFYIAFLSWSPPANAVVDHYEGWIKETGGEYRQVFWTKATSEYVRDILGGKSWEIRVIAVTHLGRTTALEDAASVTFST